MGRLSRQGLTNPCPWFALEVGVLGRLKELQPWVDGCLSCDEPISHPDMCWKTRRDCEHYLKLNYKAERSLGGVRGSAGLPARFPTVSCDLWDELLPLTSPSKELPQLLFEARLRG